MSGVDGAVKLNSLHAPSVKKTETEESVSALAVSKKPKKLIEKSAEKPVKEFVKDLLEIPVEEFVKEDESFTEEVIEEKPKTEEEIVQVSVEGLLEATAEEKPLPKKSKKINLKSEFSKVKDLVFKMYEKAFSKTPSFKPTFEETLGDLLLYLSKKLSLKNAHESFNLEFGLTGVSISEKYSKGYIPLCLKLSKWCEDKNLLKISEELLYSISSLYLSSATASGAIITELEIANDFDEEINFAL